MGNLTAGLNDYLRAQRLLFWEGLWPLFLVPGILSVLSEATERTAAELTREEDAPGFCVWGACSRFAGGIVDAFRELASRSC